MRGTGWLQHTRLQHTGRVQPRTIANSATATTAFGCAFGSLLIYSGIRTRLDPMMRPPKLPQRRPPWWGLVGAGVGWCAASLVCASRSRLGSVAFALPGAALVPFEAARYVSAKRLRRLPSKPEFPPGAIIVLGCALRNNRPSLLLRLRLERLAEWHRNSPGFQDWVIVTCGGIGEDHNPNFTEAPDSEAAVMARWLREQGIKNRILLEDQSTNTVENLTNALALLQPAIESSPRSSATSSQVPIIVVTSDFHVLRVRGLVAGFNQARWYVTGARTPARFWATSILREFLAQGPFWIGQWRKKRVGIRR